ncbi:hypothetical protein [Sinomonas terrae]|uniref:Integrase n=1 Tax=Sinomonas terrae TaxID=2908838 RepID=A0ABS9U832_9MICC|nr:hypothetical protein [Sinomonas terrae]MCH6472435.1 hypothetical protein [Sinomonas terrae]
MTAEILDNNDRAPGPETPVLANRPLRPDTDPAALSRFGDERWDLTPGIFEDHSAMTSINFGVFKEPWRNALKDYLWRLINEDQPRLLTAAKASGRPSLRTISFAKASLHRLVGWAVDEGLRGLGELDAERLDAFLADLGDSGLSYGRKQHAISEVRRLWAHRDIVDPILSMPDSPPWNDAPARDLLGTKELNDWFNRTPRIAEATLVPLVGWAVRFVEEISTDVVANYREYLRLVVRERRHWEADSRMPVMKDERRERLGQTLRELAEAGLGLPGHIEPDGSRKVRWGYLGRLTDTTGHNHFLYDQRIVEESGLPIDDDAYLLAGCRVEVAGVPWHAGHMRFEDAVRHAELLMTACYIVTAYLSGMRPGEVLALRAGCLASDALTGRLTITGTRWKGARDGSGTKAAEGEERETPWVVHPVVARAVTVLEELHDNAFLFPKNIRPQPIRRKGPATAPRAGTARTSSQIGTDVVRFVDWVNAFCHRYGRPDRIPDDTNGRLSPSRFRRTLAWHIVRRPRGLVAAAIQYGHVNVRITKGYAGDYDSGFPDEIAFERWLERLDRAKGLEEYLDSKGTVSGPAAGELERRVRETQAKYAGRVLRTGRQADKLLHDPVLQVFPGRGVHCVFDRLKALCVRKDAEAPHLAGCRSSCQNIARTDSDIADLKLVLEGLPDDLLAPAIRHQRVSAIRSSLEDIITDHEKGDPQ